MNFRPLLAFLIVAPLLNGCVVRPANPGDISFAWTFQGFHCSDDPAVAIVHVDIPGEVLDSSPGLSTPGDFTCATAGLDGITLHDFHGGNYNYTLTAFDNGGNLLYGPTSGTVRVNGNVGVNVDLAPNGAAVSRVFMKWHFAPTTSPANDPTCATAIPSGGGFVVITDVAVKIDNGSEFTVSCADGQTTGGAFLGVMEDITHTITLRALDSTGFEYERYDSTISPAGVTSTFQEVDLDWSVGGSEFSFRAFNGAHTGSGQSCATLASQGVNTIFVDFYDTVHQTYLFGGNGDAQACDDSRDLIYPYLPPGDYQLVVTAGNSTTPAIYENTGTIPVVTITAGLFPVAPTDNVDLDKVL